MEWNNWPTEVIKFDFDCIHQNWGTLQVTIRIEAQQVAGLIEVETVAARDVLQNNLPQLQARLADQGLSVSAIRNSGC